MCIRDRSSTSHASVMHMSVFDQCSNPIANHHVVASARHIPGIIVKTELANALMLACWSGWVEGVQ
eukprot:12880881-Alexandrium_andersonii.AAC.1